MGIFQWLPKEPDTVLLANAKENQNKENEPYNKNKRSPNFLQVWRCGEQYELFVFKSQCPNRPWLLFTLCLLRKCKWHHDADLVLCAGTLDLLMEVEAGWAVKVRLHWHCYEADRPMPIKYVVPVQPVVLARKVTCR